MSPLRTNKIYPFAGEQGNGGGIIQTKFATRTGEFSFSSTSGGASIYKTVLSCSIEPQNSSSKILVLAYADGIADRGGDEWESFVAHGANDTANGGDPTSWTGKLGCITGLGAWTGSQRTIGTYSMHALHSPNTTSNTIYSIITNRKSTSHWNNEFEGVDGTSIILLEISS